MRFTNDLKVLPNSFLLTLGDHTVGHGHALLISFDIDVEDELFQDLKFLSVLIHSNKFLKNMLRDVLITELPRDYRCTQMTDKLVFQFFFNEKSINITKQVVDFGYLQAELN